MMKHKKYSIVMMLPIIAAVMTACSGDNLEAEVVSGDRLAAGTVINVSGEASKDHVIPVEANCAWTVTTDVNWITITQPAAGRGSGSQNILFDVAASTIPTTQTGTITIKTGDGIERIVTVNQRPGAIVVVPSPASMFFIYEGGNQTLEVASNSQWTATSSIEWLTINNGQSVNGEGNQQLTIHANENPNSDALIGAITLTDADHKAAPVTVYVQVGGRTPKLQLTPANEVSAAGGTATFGVISNFRWDATVTGLSPAGDWDWVRFVFNNQRQMIGDPSGMPVDVTMEFDPNPSQQERVVYVVVATASPLGGNVEKLIQITQRGATMPVVYLPHTTNIKMDEATLTFSATSEALPITACGVLYAEDPHMVDQGSRAVGTLNGEEATVTIPNLHSGTTYYVKAYATSAVGTTYSETMSFKTRLTPGRNDNPNP